MPTKTKRERRIIHDGCMEIRWIYTDDPLAMIHRRVKRRPAAFDGCQGLCSWERDRKCKDHPTDRGINHRDSNVRLLRERTRTA